MASRTTLPSFLLEYMEELPNESDSDHDFEGYLEPEDGPCALLGDQDGDGTSPGEVCGSTEQPTTELESPLAGLSPSPSLCKATTRAVHRSQRPTQTAAPHPRSRREREAAAHAACDTPPPPPPPRPLWLLQGISQQETTLVDTSWL